MSKKLSIFECQPGKFCRPTEEEEGYQFIGMRDGLWLFETRQGKQELFGRCKSYAGWHLKRGQWCYEFCRSVA
jgi:hypothetical protein